MPLLPPATPGWPKSASERAASAVTVTGLIFANACSQSGMVEQARSDVEPAAHTA
jgi:hypothetical protein